MSEKQPAKTTIRKDVPGRGNRLGKSTRVRRKGEVAGVAGPQGVRRE